MKYPLWSPPLLAGYPEVVNRKQLKTFLSLCSDKIVLGFRAMNTLKKSKYLGLCFMLLAFCSGGFIPCRAADGLPAEQNELAQKAFAEKLDLQIGKKKLSSKECAKLGAVKGKKEDTTINYDGSIYTLEFRNGGDADLQNLTVECRFYYEVTESWRAKKRESSTAQKHLDYSFKISELQSKAEYSAETTPFIVESYSLPSGYYYHNGGAEVVESRPQGLWVRVFRAAADGSKTHVDFCEPPILSSNVTW
jgi:hypothetical protein